MNKINKQQMEKGLNYRPIKVFFNILIFIILCQFMREIQEGGDLCYLWLIHVVV